MGRDSRKWRLTAGFTVAACLGGVAGAHSQFVSISDRARALLEGHWQSCRESDGQYAERVYDNDLPGIGPFELHLGPYHEFALFYGVQEEHRDHSSPTNLLHPYNVEVGANRGAHRWAAAGLQLEVALGGGSRGDCESWYLSLRRAPQPSSE